MNVSTRFGRGLAVVVASAALAAGAGAATTACSSPQPVTAADVSYDPAVWGPTYQGQTYCGWELTPAECIGRPGIPMQFPTAQPPLVGSLAWAMWTDYLTYPTYYHSDRYYNTIIVGRAHYTKVNINVFHAQTKTFDTRYATAESKYDAAAKYKGPGGKVYTGNKYGSASTTGVGNRKSTTGGTGNAKTVTGKNTTSKTTTGGGYTGGRKSTTGGTSSRYSGGRSTGGRK